MRTFEEPPCYIDPATRDLRCAIHHTRMVVPRAPTRWDRRLERPPWCTECAQERQGQADSA